MKIHGLHPTPKDPRDFPLEKIFGSANPTNLPNEYVVSKPLVIKDQGDTDMCTAYALTAVSEDQEGVILDPFYTFGATKRITGRPDDWGADLRSACKSAIASNGGGFLPATARGVNVEQTATEEDRKNAVARGVGSGEAWAIKKYAKETYFAVNTSGDVFDSMRSAMWQTRSEERSIFTGIDWNPEWDNWKGGFIDRAEYGNTYGHAIKIFGWDGDWALAQLSNGRHIGEGGIFKLHRDVVNAFCKYGAFTLLDLPREVAEYELGKIGYWNYWLKSFFA